MNKLINLHFASEYSFFESPTTIKEYVEWAKNNGLKTLVLTDHNFVFGFAEFKKECEKNNIKPIYGVDLDVDDFRLILLAKNIDGFNEILNLSYLKSFKKISIDDIDDKNLFIINHPSYGSKNISLLKNKFINFYWYDQNDSNSNIFINDNRITSIEKEDDLFFINEIKGNNLNEFNSYLCSFDYDVNQNLIEKTNEIANNCSVIFEAKQNVLPKISIDGDDLKELKKLIEFGFKNKKNELELHNKNTVVERINYELSIVEKMGVANYFLIIADIIDWSRKNNILIGPGRGSVSGSLVAFLIGITNINPLKYNLYFERFLNPERISMPDIDVDIQDDKREDVINYIKTKYGEDSVAQICTFQRMGAKQSLKDVGRYLNINFAEINEISKLIPGNETLLESYQENSKFKSKIDSSSEYSKLFKLATKIESLPRQTGTHAAGIVIAKNKIINNCPIMKIENNNITQFSMEYLEDWNLLKIDLLGLRTLTIIKKMEEEIRKIYDKEFSLNEIPLEDPKVNKLLSSGRVSGIFQLESHGMTKTIQDIKIDSFFDLVDIISLYRPGPLSNIGIYLNNKNNNDFVEKIHPLYDDVVKPTHGIIIYQEQIMEIAQKIASFSFGQADILRKAISKKNKDEIDQLKSLFILNSIKNGISDQKAKTIYEQIEKFAEYGFNKSHAVAYATLSYKMAYIKTKFPICFYSTLISLVSSVESVNKYVKEARELKFNIESPSINKISNDIVHNKIDTIWLPLTFIKGIGTAIFEKILNEYNNSGSFKTFFEFVVRMKKCGVGDAVIETLILANALREFGNMNTLINNLENALNYASVALYKSGDNYVVDENTKIPNMQIYDEDLEMESKNEAKFLGMIYNSFPTSKYETKDKLINLKVGIEYVIPLYINNKKEIMNKFKKISYILEVSDSSTNESIFFNEKNKNIFDQIKINSLGYATVIKLDKNGKIYFNITNWKVIK